MLLIGGGSRGKTSTYKMTENCMLCQRPKASVHCGTCEGALCKSCETFLDPEHFAFLEKVPEEFTRIHYCPDCFEEEVAPALAKYDETLERARDVYVFFGADRHAPHPLKKAKWDVEITDCKDRDETILRLGFRAAEQGFNALLKGRVAANQVRNHGYQKSVWEGKGL